MQWDFYMKVRYKGCIRGDRWLTAWCQHFFNVCSMKRQRVLLLPLDGMLVHHNRLLPTASIMPGCPNNSPVPIYTPGWREALRVKYVAQEHNTMTQAST